MKETSERTSKWNGICQCGHRLSDHEHVNYDNGTSGKCTGENCYCTAFAHTPPLPKKHQPASPDVSLINEGNNVPDTNVGDIAESPTPTKEGAEIPIPEEFRSWAWVEIQEALQEEEWSDKFDSVIHRITTAMYRKMQEEKAELLQALIADQAKELSNIQSALSSMTKERNAALEIIRDITDSRIEANEYRKVLEGVQTDLKTLSCQVTLARIVEVLNKYKPATNEGQH